MPIDLWMMFVSLRITSAWTDPLAFLTRFTALPWEINTLFKYLQKATATLLKHICHLLFPFGFKTIPLLQMLTQFKSDTQVSSEILTWMDHMKNPSIFVTQTKVWPWISWKHKLNVSLSHPINHNNSSHWMEIPSVYPKGLSKDWHTSHRKTNHNNF